MNYQEFDIKHSDTAAFLAVSHEYFSLKTALAPSAHKLSLMPKFLTKSDLPRKKMNTCRQLAQSLLLVTGLGAFIAAPAFAESPCGPIGSYEARAEQQAKRMEQHHMQLHDALKLTAEQEPGWKKLMDSEQPKPSTSGAAKPEDWAKLTTPERAEKRLELGKARQEHMAEYVGALKGFYDSLSAEQKKTFEDMHANQQRDMRGKPGARNRGAGPAPAKP